MNYSKKDLKEILCHPDGSSQRDRIMVQTPSDAQKDAGNYKKLHFNCHGLRFSIENPRGSTRTGVSKDGTSYQNTMSCDYGYIRGTEGAD